MAKNIEGPYGYKGILSEQAKNSDTIHPAIVEFKGHWYFFYHNGILPGGGSYSRSVCVRKLEYDKGNRMRLSGTR